MKAIPLPVRERILRLYKQGRSTLEIAEFSGFCVAAVRRVRQHFRERGTARRQIAGDHEAGAMKLLKQIRNGWEYELNHQEAMCLRTIICEFPLTPATHFKATKTESGRKAAEREQLLNESLAEHRMDLKRQATKLLASGKLKAGQAAWRLRLNLEEREILLQLLNDIRVGSWRALGEPEDLESKPPAPSEKQVSFHTLMQLAGYFEVKLLNLEGSDQAVSVE
jgi:hypothetical protein